MTIAEWLEEKGRAEGLQQGIEEGRQAEARHIAKRMLAGGIAPSLIIDFTGLSDEELTALSH